MWYSRTINDRLANFGSPQTAVTDDASSLWYRDQMFLHIWRSIDRCCFQIAVTTCNWQTTKEVPFRAWSQLCDSMVNVSGKLVLNPACQLVSLQNSGVPEYRATTNGYLWNEYHRTKFSYCKYQDVAGCCHPNSFRTTKQSSLTPRSPHPYPTKTHRYLEDQNWKPFPYICNFVCKDLTNRVSVFPSHLNLAGFSTKLLLAKFLRDALI